MSALARFVLAGLHQAVLVTVGFAVLALVIPPLGLLSGAAVALVTLRLGGSRGLLLAAVSAAVLAGLGMLARQSPLVGLLAGLLQWLPIVGLAAVLRVTQSWTFTLQTALLVALGGILLLHALLPDATAFWQERLTALLEPVLQQAGHPPERIEATLAAVARFAGGLLFASLLLGTVLMVMMGRALQAALYKPGGFAAEFRDLRLGRWPALLAVVLVAAALFSRAALPQELALVLLVVLAIQGLAVIHGTAARLRLHPAWLWGFYFLLLVLFSPMLVVLAGLGTLDAFLDLRRRVPAAS